MRPNVFERHPHLSTLKGLVPDEVIEREIADKEEEFISNSMRAKKSIPTVNLNKVFPELMEKGGIYLENFLGHWGNVSIEELCKICLVVKFIKPKRILEIGTYNGMTTLQMALNAPRECITYTLDLPEGSFEEGTELDRYISTHFRTVFGTQMGEYFKKRDDLHIVQLIGDASTFDYSIINGSLDIVFIDAAHDYCHIKIDTENALRLLAPGGVIIWHNYLDITNPDVTRFLADLSLKYDLYHFRNTSIVVYWNK